MTPSRLLKSWATPPASWPRLSSRWDWCSWRSIRSRSVWARSRSRSAWISSRSVTSRIAAVTRIPSSVSMADREISAGNSVPSRRRPASSIPAPIGRGRGSATYPARWPGCAPGLVGDQQLHRLADQLVPAVPEQPLGLGVDQRDPPVGSDAHHRVRGRLEQPAEPGVGPLALGHIPGDRGHPRDRPRGVGDGDMVRDTPTVVWSLRTRRASYCSTRSPRATAASARCLLDAVGHRDEYLDVTADHLGGGVPVQPLRARFQLVITWSRVLPITAS